MTGTLVNNSSPRKISYPSRKSTRTIRNIGTTLAAELGALIQKVGENHPDLHEQILRYIEQLDDRHPEWRPDLERVRYRQLRRLEGHRIRGLL